MKNIIVTAGMIITVFVLLISLCACNTVPDKYVREWNKNSEYTDADYTVIQVEDEVRILQLTDIHYDNSNDRKEDTLDLIKKVMENSDADMIAVTGDWCYYTPFNKKEKCKEVFDIIDSFNIPWAPVFGNHDAEIFVNKYEYADMFQQYSNCIFDCGYSNIGGAGNYTVVFKNNDEIKFAAVMMDTHSSVRMFSTQYDHIKQGQIDWYEWTIDNLNTLYKDSGGKEDVVPTALYTHIPINEYVDAYEQGEILTGENKEKCCVPETNTHIFDSILSKASTKAIFCGHDHANGSVSLYQGVQFVYGIQSGWCKNYADDCNKGGTMAVFEGSNVNVSWILYEK